MNNVVEIFPTHFDIGNGSASNVLALPRVNALNKVILTSELNVVPENPLYITVQDTFEIQEGDCVEIIYTAVLLRGPLIIFGTTIPDFLLNKLLVITCTFVKGSWKVIVNPLIGLNTAVINGADIVNNSIDSNKILNNSISTSKIQDNSVSTSKLLNGAVDNSKLADSSISANKLQAASVTPDKISNTAAQKVLLVPKIFDFNAQGVFDFVLLPSSSCTLIGAAVTVTETAIGAGPAGSYTISGSVAGTLGSGSIPAAATIGSTNTGVILAPGIVAANEVISVNNTSAQTTGKFSLTLIYRI
jgi:hypothetical protein